MNGKPNGFSRALFKNGSYYEGMVKDGVREGAGKFVYSDGRVDEGEFQDGDFRGN